MCSSSGDCRLCICAPSGGRWARRLDVPRSRCDGIVVVLNMSGAKRRTPPVVVRSPRTAPLSEEKRQQAVTALTVMIHEWWSAGQSNGADAGPDRRGGTAEDDQS